MKQFIPFIMFLVFSCSDPCVEEETEDCTTESNYETAEKKDNSFEYRSINTVSRKSCVRHEKNNKYCFD